MKRFMVTGLVAVLMLAGTVVQAAEETGLTDAQKDMLRALARGDVKPWPPATAVQLGGLHEKAAKQWDVLHRDMLPHGQVVDVFWNDYERTSPMRYETVGDATCWTGHYLAALALRYKVLQEPEVLERIQRTLDIFNKLTVASGVDGYIVRYVGPADSEPYREYYKVYGRGEDPERPGLGKWAYRAAAPYEDEIWLGNSSRDTYIGFNLGVSAAWALVDDPQVREKITEMVTRVGERLIADDWTIKDSAHGHTTRSTPWFKLSWMRTMVTVAPDKFPQVAEEYEKAAADALEAGYQRISPKTYGEYFANNLRFAIAYSLYLMEPDAQRKGQYADGIRKMYSDMQDHLNAYFAMMYLAVTGDDNEPARATAIGQLIDLPGPPRWTRRVDYSTNPDLDLIEGGKHLRYAMLASEQVPTDFLWQRSPTVSSGSGDASYEFPGLDLVLPYWMGRAYGILGAPAASE